MKINMEETSGVNISVNDGRIDHPVVDIEHLRKSFENNYVLNDINLKIRKGENVVVLGKSGSGKSVLIKCIIRLIEPDDGRLMILGKNIPDLNEKELIEVRRKIGFLFQSGALYDSMSVRENLEFPLRRQSASINKETITCQVEAALHNVGLESAIDLMPSELSGGMRKRIGLARTLILKPELILYDEPTTGLDPITSREISKLILKVQKKYEATSIIITHDLECARITGNRIIVLKNGMFAQEGTYNELEKDNDPWIRSFFEETKS
jgi:phospholipid/cholesterol/gamma-HCH transport system ATP-binding protein